MEVVDCNRDSKGRIVFTQHVVSAIGPVQDGTPRGKDCTHCQGRGWFSIDMEGSGFHHCNTCKGRGYVLLQRSRNLA